MVLKPDLKGLTLFKFYHLSVTSVLYLPICPFNLLSVSRLTQSLNCSITFINKMLPCRIGLRNRRLASDLSLKASTTSLRHLPHAPPQILHSLYMRS